MTSSRMRAAQEDVVPRAEPNIHWAFIKRRLDLTPVFWPITTRKILMLTLYLGIIGGIAALQAEEDEPWKGLSEEVRAKIIALMVVLYSVEPIVFTLGLFFSTYPDNLRKPDIAIYTAANRDIEAQERYRPDIIAEENRRLGMVIPAHNSSKVIGATVTADLKIVLPGRILVVDNGSTDEEAEATKRILERIHTGIVYLRSLEGNKTKALYFGARVAAALGCEEVLIHDDDVITPVNFRMEALDDEHAGIVYPIFAVRSDGKRSIITECQTGEYYGSDLNNGLLARFDATAYPHGAAAAYKIEDLLAILLRHNAVFFAEDVRMGLIAASLGKKMRFGSYLFPTLVPENFYELYNQRVESWGFGVNTVLPLLLRNFFTRFDLPLKFLLARKFTEFYTLYSLAMDEWFRVPIIILSATFIDYWPIFAGFILARQALFMIMMYVKFHNKPDMQEEMRLVSVLAMPVYNVTQMIFSFLSLIRFLTIYLPNKTHMPPISELVAEGKLDYIDRYLGVEKQPLAPFLTTVELPRLSGSDSFLSLFRARVTPVGHYNLREAARELDKASHVIFERARLFINGAKYLGYAVTGIAVAMLLTMILLNQLSHRSQSANTGPDRSIDMAISMLGIVAAALIYTLASASLSIASKSRLADINRNKLRVFERAQPDLAGSALDHGINQQIH